MSFFGWDNCPEQSRMQVKQLVTEFHNLLEENLRGVYLHGSLAAGCFNPVKSDVDLLVVTYRRLPVELKQSLIEVILRSSGSPHPLEISFLSSGDISPWQYPTPFDLHYSEDWREKYEKDLRSRNWRYWPVRERVDSDLAAHITVTKKRGVCLWGEPVEQIMPDVPGDDFAASIASDLEWALERLDKYPMYGALNACRIYAYFREGHIFSKEEGAEWAMKNMPIRFRSVIKKALEAYRSSERDVVVAGEEEIRQMFGYVSAVIKAAKVTV